MRTFTLVRDEDETGISGTGTVAEGIEFTDGTVALKWVVGEHQSTVLWPGGMKSVEAIHGHGGKTRIVWTPDDLATFRSRLYSQGCWLVQGGGRDDVDRGQALAIFHVYGAHEAYLDAGTPVALCRLCTLQTAADHFAVQLTCCSHDWAHVSATRKQADQFLHDYVATNHACHDHLHRGQIRRVPQRVGSGFKVIADDMDLRQIYSKES